VFRKTSALGTAQCRHLCYLSVEVVCTYLLVTCSWLGWMRSLSVDRPSTRPHHFSIPPWWLPKRTSNILPPKGNISQGYPSPHSALSVGDYFNSSISRGIRLFRLLVLNVKYPLRPVFIISEFNVSLFFFLFCTAKVQASRACPILTFFQASQYFSSRDLCVTLLGSLSSSLYRSLTGMCHKINWSLIMYDYCHFLFVITILNLLAVLVFSHYTRRIR
jgi:hypothetical protein